MRGQRPTPGVSLLALSCGVVSAALWSKGAAANTAEAEYTGFRLQLDNDLFAQGGRSDRDYTGGLAVTISGRSAQDSALSLDPLLKTLDRLSIGEGEDGSIVRTARQFGVMAFTPQDITQSAPQENDRPYASLVFIANGRLRVDPDKTAAWFTSFSIGVLGLPAAEQLQNAIHDVVGSARPRGYDNQISAGGEPTARYTVARQKLWMSTPTSTLDVKTTVQASVGYLTETSAAISIRAGRFSSPWWTFNPELTDYLAAPAPIAEPSARRADKFFFAGAKLKARAYNAFLQGQFRHSEVRHTSSNVEPLIAEAWVGFTSQVGKADFSYTLNYQTREVRSGPAARDYAWGAVQIAFRF